MNGVWANSLDQIWRAPTLPMWLALAASVFFALIVLATLLRAEKSVANGALTVITLLAIGVAAAATLRKSETAGQEASHVASMPQLNASLPALSCLDDLAGDMVLAGCEKVLFGSADSVAAAVSASAVQINRLTSHGDVAAANKSMTPELAGLRRAVERDRYGLIAYVLQSRDRCTPESCAAYTALTDHKRIAANMEERTYEGLVTRYAPGWNAPPAAAAAATGALAGLPASVPTGKPTTADFPSSASIPPISIMTETPVPAPKTPPAAANAQAPAPRAATATPPPAAAKKQPPAPKAAARPQAPASPAPVQLAPETPPADN
ncbi:hypothetical protein SAMN03159423_0002 [Bradyrhizobium sp. NFR13]|jgi:hypothetical protein|uniref:hypothetical protein n=1 Tax=Bradyrhizobium sp. NFR13 TaxID=1566285 RepID=UPI0008DF7DA8|nr:hypothetical protein [Bradyrhizobium sp. NFR13]SFM21333.1 hypothetical protein SAMN03159423_0002 [Bradyrhizobium sp. NFR13]